MMQDGLAGADAEAVAPGFGPAPLSYEPWDAGA